MNDSRFDDISRRIARVTGLRQSRRGILKVGAAAGLATTVGGPELCGAAPVAGSSSRLAVGQQASPDQLLIQQIAFDLGYDMQKIFRFVADEIGYESYDGALRGVRGTIWSGAGNSVDQAQLLHALLTEAIADVRFAVGSLADADATTLVETMSAERISSETLENARAINRAAEAEQRAPIAAATPVPGQPDGSEVADRVSALREQLFAEAGQALAADVAAITDALAGANVEAPSDAPSLAATERERHVWVQIRQGGEWVDLDPSFAGSEAGATPATVSETMTELPADLFHVLTFRVIAETLGGDSLAEQVMLDYTVKSQDLVGEDVLIMHIEPESLEAIGSGISAVLGGQISYYPLIVLGQEGYLADTTITFGSDGGVLSEDILGGGGDVQEGNCLAERFEVTVASPGVEPITVSRMLFDRVPAAQRASGILDLSAIPPVQEVELGNGERGVLEVKRVVAMASVVSLVDADYLTRPIPDETLVSSYTGAIHGMYALRESLDAAQTSLPDTYLNRPNLTAYTTIPIPVEDGGNPGVRIDADLLLQSYGFRSSTADGAGIYAGVLAQKAERLALSKTLLGEMFEIGALPVRPELPADVQDVFTAAAEAGVETLVVTEADNPALNDLDVADDVLARISAVLELGRVVIVPAHSVEVAGASSIAWWVFDPATGALYDQMADGRSGASVLAGPLAEYAKQLWIFTKTVKGFMALGACVAAIMRGVAALSGNSVLGGVGNVEGALFSCGAYAAGGLP